MIFPNHVYVAVIGSDHQDGRVIFYEPFKKDLITTIKNRGYVETEWEDLYQHSEKPYWIRVEKIPSFSDFVEEV
jgi:hypothetical protein